jgi:phosphatidylserine decarboxylase
VFRGIKQRMSIKVEQFRQAKSIHGGLVRLYFAHLAVKLSRVPIPTRRLRLRLFRDLYTRMYPPGLNEQEAEQPLESYRSFNAVFTRGVKPECRRIDASSQRMVSPCDGTVQDVGRIEGGRLLTVKGIEYSLGSLLPAMDTDPYEGAWFAIIFLTPIDCHRVFSPQNGCLKQLIHVPGARLLVHPPFQRAEYPVYALNERMIFRFWAESGPCVLVMVAGWGVGNITLACAPEFQPRSKRIDSWIPESPRPVKRGDWIATFELGSSVVLITSSHDALPAVSPNEKVQYGQPVFRFGSVDSPLPRGS